MLCRRSFLFAPLALVGAAGARALCAPAAGKIANTFNPFAVALDPAPLAASAPGKGEPFLMFADEWGSCINPGFARLFEQCRTRAGAHAQGGPA